MNPLKHLLRKIPVLLLCAFCVFFIASAQRSIFEAEQKTSPEIKDIQQIFPQAKNIKIVFQPDSQKFLDGQDKVFDVFDGYGNLIGTILYSGERSTFRGYAGDVPFIIGFDLSGHIIGVDIIHHQETPDVIRYLRNTKFFRSWNGLTVQQALVKEVDAVSAATMTAEAVIQGLRQSLSTLSDRQAPEHERGARTPWVAAAVLVLAFALASFFYSQKFSRWRFWLLCLTVSVFGFWGKEMLSLSQFFNWMIWLPQEFSILMLVFLLSVLIPLFLSRGFYCPYVCPYGALQEIVARTNKKKFSFSKGLHQKAMVLGWIYFWLIVVGLILGFPMTLESFEPFSAFLFQGAALGSMIIACLFLWISFFLPRAWCTFFCPTGKVFQALTRNFFSKRK